MEIRAAVLREAKTDFRIETLTLDEPREDEVLVRLVATGVCHTDIAVQHGQFPMPLPMVLGHEGAGIVERAGAKTKLKKGDAVVLSFDSCGTCRNCATHHPAYCATYAALNYSGGRSDGSALLADQDGKRVNGAFFRQSSFATYAITGARNAIKVRDDAPLELLGALGCGFLTGAGTVLNVLKPRADSSLLILGAGAIGFTALFAAKHLGCQRIVAVDRVASRLALAKELGATEVIDTSTTDLDAALKALGGVDYVVDTTGAPRLVEAAVRVLNAQGEVALIGGGPDRMLTVDLVGLIRGKVIRGVVEGDADPAQLIPRLVDLYMEGAFPIDRICRPYPFDDINAAVADADRGVAIKPILKF